MGIHYDVEGSGKSGRMAMKRVTNRTRAPYRGRVIQCPACGEKTRVYHFSWCSIVCGSGDDKSGCGLAIDKGEWLIVSRLNEGGK